MSGIRPFIPKQDQSLPDYYEIKVFYVTGKTDIFEGIHYPHLDKGIIEVVTKDDVWSMIPIGSIQRMEFDKRFSQVIEARKRVQNG